MYCSYAAALLALETKQRTHHLPIIYHKIKKPCLNLRVLNHGTVQLSSLKLSVSSVEDNCICTPWTLYLCCKRMLFDIKLCECTRYSLPIANILQPNLCFAHTKKFKFNNLLSSVNSLHTSKSTQLYIPITLNVRGKSALKRKLIDYQSRALSTCWC